MLRDLLEPLRPGADADRRYGDPYRRSFHPDGDSLDFYRGPGYAHEYTDSDSDNVRPDGDRDNVRPAGDRDNVRPDGDSDNVCAAGDPDRPGTAFHAGPDAADPRARTPTEHDACNPGASSSAPSLDGHLARDQWRREPIPSDAPHRVRIHGACTRSPGTLPSRKVIREVKLVSAEQH